MVQRTVEEKMVLASVLYREVAVMEQKEKRNHMIDRRTFLRLIDELARGKRVNTATKRVPYKQPKDHLLVWSVEIIEDSNGFMELMDELALKGDSSASGPNRVDLKGYVCSPS